MVDTNVLIDREFLHALAPVAHRFLQVYWCPTVITEVNRLLTWMWLKRNGASFTEDAWRRCSEDSRKWFGHMTQIFLVADDSPPPEDGWSDNPPDEGDVPIWTAAVRVKVHFIVTNDKDFGPQPCDHGVRAFNGIRFVSAKKFVEILDWWTDVVTAADLPVIDSEQDVPPPLPPLEDYAQEGASAATSQDDCLKGYKEIDREFFRSLNATLPDGPVADR